MRILLALLFCCFGGSAFSQGIVTENGFGLGGGLSTQDDLTTLSASAGYVATSFEVGVGFRRSADDAVDASVLGIAPYVGFYPVRQNEAFPVSVRLGASYSFLSFSGDAFDELESFGVDLSGSGYSVGGSLFSEIQATPSLRIIPSGGLSYESTTLKAEADGLSESDTESVVVFGGGLVFAFDVSPTSTFTVTPSFAVAEGETAFGISVGVVFPR